MKYTTHSYSSAIDIILFWAFNLFGLYFVFGSFYVAIQPWYENILGNILSFAFFFIAGLIILFFGNLFPEVVTDRDGLLVRFMFWRFRVKWEDVIGIKQDKLTSFLSGTSHYIVQTKSLTFLHRFYGLYALSLKPSFLMQSKITNFKLLLERIQNRRFDITNIDEVVKA